MNSFIKTFSRIEQDIERVEEERIRVKRTQNLMESRDCQTNTAAGAMFYMSLSRNLNDAERELRKKYPHRWIQAVETIRSLR